MALEPDDRYASPKALGDDIEHWMADEPVSAYRDPWLARLGAVGAPPQDRRGHLGRAPGRGCLRPLRRIDPPGAGTRPHRPERALAVKNYGYAYEAAETMLSRVGDVDLADIPQMEARPAGAAGDRRAPVSEAARAAQPGPGDPAPGGPHPGSPGGRAGDDWPVRRGRAERPGRHRFAQDLEEPLPRGRSPSAAKARASHGLGVLLRKLNRFHEAETALREALHLREQLAARFPDDRDLGQGPGRTAATTWVPCWPGWPDPTPGGQSSFTTRRSRTRRPCWPSNLTAGEPDEAGSQYLNNLAILEARTRPGPGRASNSARSLTCWRVWTPPGVPCRAPGGKAARASNNLAHALGRHGTGEQERRDDSLSRARDELDRLFAEFPRILQYRRELASIFNNLGRLGRDREQAELASRSRSARPPTCSRPLADRVSPGSGLSAEPGDRRPVPARPAQRPRPTWPPAEAAARPVLDDQEKLIAAYPAVPDYRNALGRNLLRVWQVALSSRANRAWAATLIEKAVARFQEALKEDPGNRTYTKNLTEALTLQM